MSSEPNSQDTNKADEIVSKWDCSVSENESDESLALLSDAIASAIAEARAVGQLLRPEFDYRQDDDGLFQAALPQHQSMFDALNRKIANAFRRGQSDMAAKAAEVVRKEMSDYEQLRDMSNDADRPHAVSALCGLDRALHLILALSPDPSYAVTLRDKMVEKVKAQPRFSVVSGEFEERSNGEFIDRDDVLQILEKE